MRFLNIKTLVLLAVFIFSVVFSLPSILNTSGPKITLGLDLQGGLNILLGVDTNEAINSKYSSIATEINHEAQSNNIFIDSLSFDSNGIGFELLDISSKEALDSILSKIKGIDINYSDGVYRIVFTADEARLIEASSIDQAIDTIRNRLDIFGLSEPSVTKQGNNNIIVQLPGVKTAQDEQNALDLIIRPAQLKMMAVDEERASNVNSMTDLEAKKYGDIILGFVNDPNSKILLKEIPVIDGSMLVDARVAFDNSSNQRVITFRLNSIGAKIFADFSGNNVGKRMAIVLDNKVYSAPNIRERIGGGSGQITGSFSEQEAKNIAIALRSGSLSVPLELLEKRSVGPSLGADSIKASLIALFGAFVAIIVFMIIYYGFAGFIAVITLLINVLGIIACMSLFGATLTLPGMAGIVLTVGMAIDANIIINERIREALRLGESIVKSIAFGYANATRAIFDANNTTIIIAILLYAYGTGPIKGFAVTMGIGIVISIITAIIGTHGIYLWLGAKINNSKNLGFWFGVRRRTK